MRAGNGCALVGTYVPFSSLQLSWCAANVASRVILLRVFDEVIEVNLTDSADSSHLAFLKRPELGLTLTKLHCWTLTRYSKCVFLDADTLVSPTGGRERDFPLGKKSARDRAAPSLSRGTFGGFPPGNTDPSFTSTSILSKPSIPSRASRREQLAISFLPREGLTLTWVFDAKQNNYPPQKTLPWLPIESCSHAWTGTPSFLSYATPGWHLGKGRVAWQVMTGACKNSHWGQLVWLSG